MLDYSRHKNGIFTHRFLGIKGMSFSVFFDKLILYSQSLASFLTGSCSTVNV